MAYVMAILLRLHQLEVHQILLVQQLVLTQSLRSSSLKRKKGSFTPKAAPDLSPENFWFYKEAHTIDQKYSMKACGMRQKHIDQAQSFNLYITPEIKAKDILNLYIQAYGRRC